MLVCAAVHDTLVGRDLSSCDRSRGARVSPDTDLRFLSPKSRAPLQVGFRHTARLGMRDKKSQVWPPALRQSYDRIGAGFHPDGAIVEMGSNPDATPSTAATAKPAPTEPHSSTSQVTYHGLHREYGVARPECCRCLWLSGTGCRDASIGDVLFVCSRDEQPGRLRSRHPISCPSRTRDASRRNRMSIASSFSC